MVIARFSYPFFLTILAFALLMAVFPWWVIATGLRDVDGVKLTQYWMGWLLLVLSPLCAWICVMMIRALLAHGGNAAWISEGVLYYARYPAGMFDWRSLLSFINSCPFSEIKFFSVGVLNSNPLSQAPDIKGIFIHAGDGQPYGMATHLMREPRDEILARLNQALADSRH